jgi:hypothetical protein
MAHLSPVPLYHSPRFNRSCWLTSSASANNRVVVGGVVCKHIPASRVAVARSTIWASHAKATHCHSHCCTRDSVCASEAKHMASEAPATGVLSESMELDARGKGGVSTSGFWQVLPRDAVPPGMRPQRGAQPTMKLRPVAANGGAAELTTVLFNHRVVGTVMAPGADAGAVLYELAAALGALLACVLMTKHACAGADDSAEPNTPNGELWLDLVNRRAEGKRTEGQLEARSLVSMERHARHV